ncbi:hypothetical protein [Streptomyces sp. NBC_01216]|uniref:hypothetical protein n=1 Tax=unclassified Streptomyces TaxID=2593676 RepID=UPI002E120077|nr:hypothetical protein OG393_18265 [Streptomyces sp. NBC_01216]
MKKILPLALAGLSLAGTLGSAGTAVAESDLGLSTVVPLSGVLDPGKKQPAPADLPPANAMVQSLLPGR